MSSMTYQWRREKITDIIDAILAVEAKDWDDSMVSALIESLSEPELDLFIERIGILAEQAVFEKRYKSMKPNA